MANVKITVTDNPQNRSTNVNIFSVDGTAVSKYACTMMWCHQVYITCVSFPFSSLSFSLSFSLPLYLLSLLYYLGGEDFEPVNQQILIDSSQYVLPLLLSADRDPEEDESFSLFLTTDDMGVNVTTDITLITITDVRE